MGFIFFKEYYKAIKLSVTSYEIHYNALKIKRVNNTKFALENKINKRVGSFLVLTREEKII